MDANSNRLCLDLPDDNSTITLGHNLASVLGSQATVFLFGNLGMGKTTLSRGILQGLGYHGRVKSPTYTLVEPYELVAGKLYHFDLYRLSDPEELELIGIRDYFDEQAICLVEWPELGKEILPKADIELKFAVKGHGRIIEIYPETDKGLEIINKLKLII